MFDKNTPRLFAEPPGVSFADALVTGLKKRMQKAPPDALARVTLIVNTARMRDQIIDRMARDAAGFLPRIHLVTDYEAMAPGIMAAPAEPKLFQRLELTELVRELLQKQAGLAPKSAAFALAGSLQDLLAEMQEEAVEFQKIIDLKPENLAEHWGESLEFLTLIAKFLGPLAAPSEEKRAREVQAKLFDMWRDQPPETPVILAGSTGSRAPTFDLMKAVAKLPAGAVVLPGFDFDNMPAEVWALLSDPDATVGGDHPQSRLAKVCRALEVDPLTMQRWSQVSPPSSRRNALISLALRPAPVTDAWLSKGPSLIPSLCETTQDLTLLEATAPREEANAIALGLRAAVADGKRAALITLDRALARQVTTALERWGIIPDDSAGQALAQTPAGRLLRLISQKRGRRVSADTLLILLKHPLVARGSAGRRNDHLRLTRDLEVELLRGRTPFPEGRDLDLWVDARERKKRDAKDPDFTAKWANWVARVVDALASEAPSQSLRAHHADLLRLLELLSNGPSPAPGYALDDFEHGPAGAKAAAVLKDLEQAADRGGAMSAVDFAAVLSDLTTFTEVRDQVSGHPQVQIWGAMEARVQTADLIILGGLNEGVWPNASDIDPWLNRSMRAKAGLRSPERVVGLSAHDFQQAVAAPQVWLTRSIRDAEAETVPSRWINRLINLLDGLGGDGAAALTDMRRRGEEYLTLARRLDRPTAAPDPAPRPAPAPPADARPTQLSVTQIEKLVRDPYAIYARKVLDLSVQDPLRATADAPLRGTVLHAVLEKFVDATRDGLPEDALDIFTASVDAELQNAVPWAATRRFWRGRLLARAEWFLESEAERRDRGTPKVIEEKAAMEFATPPFTLTAKADRIDIDPLGQAVIYDYKTGPLPSQKQQEYFNKQLPLEALIVEGGGFASIGPVNVASMHFISLGTNPKEEPSKAHVTELPTYRAEFTRLLMAYQQPTQGYASRRAVEDLSFAGDYDHLARYGEWGDTARAQTIKVGDHG